MRKVLGIARFSRIAGVRPASVARFPGMRTLGIAVIVGLMVGCGASSSAPKAPGAAVRPPARRRRRRERDGRRPAASTRPTPRRRRPRPRRAPRLLLLPRRCRRRRHAGDVPSGRGRQGAAVAVAPPSVHAASRRAARRSRRPVSSPRASGTTIATSTSGSRTRSASPRTTAATSRCSRRASSRPRAPHANAQHGARTELDVQLVLDTTGSMGDELSYLQSEFDSIATQVRTKFPNVTPRWSLVVYRDHGDEYVAQGVRLHDRHEQVPLEPARAVGGRRRRHARGGRRGPRRRPVAAVAHATRTSRSSSFWVADAPRIPARARSSRSVIRDAKKKGVHIYPVASSDADDAAEYQMRSAAQMTAGRYVFLTNDSGIGNSHAEPHIPCYNVSASRSRDRPHDPGRDDAAASSRPESNAGHSLGRPPEQGRQVPALERHARRELLTAPVGSGRAVGEGVHVEVARAAAERLVARRRVAAGVEGGRDARVERGARALRADLVVERVAELPRGDEDVVGALRAEDRVVVRLAGDAAGRDRRARTSGSTRRRPASARSSASRSRSCGTRSRDERSRRSSSSRGRAPRRAGRTSLLMALSFSAHHASNFACAAGQRVAGVRADVALDGVRARQLAGRGLGAGVDLDRGVLAGSGGGRSRRRSPCRPPSWSHRSRWSSSEHAEMRAASALPLSARPARRTRERFTLRRLVARPLQGHDAARRRAPDGLRRAGERAC